MWWYVYYLKCADGGFYVGCTKYLKARLERHRTGKVKSTRGRLPVYLCLCMAFPSKDKAFKFESYLKSGSGRAFAKRHFDG